MADAEIIPLGTRGRPGRGTGRARPSSSSRALAGRGEVPPQPGGQRDAGDGAAEQTEPEGRAPESEVTGDAGSRTAAEEAVPVRATVEPAAGAGAAGTGSSPRSRRIPAAELLHVLRSAAAEVFGDDWEPRLAELLAFLRRRVTGDYAVDEYGLDQEVVERFFMAAIRPLAEKWFRLEVRGVENIPAEGGALLVSNHSGTFPFDGMVTGYAVHAHTGRNLRPLGADLVFRLPFVGEMARKAGATLACNEDAQRMLSGGELVGVWPEGFKGIGKPYSERYKLQRFGRGGFVAAAVRTGVPIVPCSVVGAEEIYPLVGNIPALARLLGVPYIPITPLFPLLGPLGLVPLPSKWIIEFGEPIRTDTYEAGAAEDPMLVFDVTDQVRETIQQTLYKLLMRRASVFH